MRRPAMRAWGVALAALLLSGWLHASADGTSRNRQGGDEYAFGGSVRIDQPVAGDLIAAGGNIDVEAQVGGDVIAVGGQVRIGAPVGGSVLGGSGRLVLDSTVGRNVRVGGGQVDLNPKSVVAGNLTVGGGQVSLRGEVKGSVTIGGGRVTIDGPVGGDVESAAGVLALGPNARIAGKLRLRSNTELTRDPSAQVGTLEQLPPTGAQRDGQPPSAEATRHAHRGWSGPGWAWTIGMMLLAVALGAAMPATARRVAQTWRERLGWSLLWGFVALVCVPLAAVLVAVTVIGIPVALLVLLAYGAALLAGYAVSGLALGQWVLGRWRAADAERPAWRLGATAAGVLFVAFLGSLPYVGGLFALLAVCIGLGALVQLLRTPGAALPSPGP